MSSKDYVKIWSTKRFRNFLYEEKAKTPDKTFGQIMEDLIKERDKKRSKKDAFFGKF